MLSQLDTAIDRGEVWVAYQPKLDLATRRIIGAEALARWTHPESGPIAASEFVAAAEQNDFIGKLTDFPGCSRKRFRRPRGSTRAEIHSTSSTCRRAC